MQLTMMRAKLHRVTVTQADLNYEGSIGIGPALLKASDILPGEYIHVWNLTNGNRAQTYAMAGGEGRRDLSQRRVGALDASWRRCNPMHVLVGLVRGSQDAQRNRGAHKREQQREGGSVQVNWK